MDASKPARGRGSRGPRGGRATRVGRAGKPEDSDATKAKVKKASAVSPPPARGGVNKRGRGRAGRGPGSAAAAAAGATGATGAEDNQQAELALSVKGWFTKDLRIMMYGFGDDQCPLVETVDLVEDILTEYMQELAYKSSEIAADSLKNKIDEKDVLFLFRKDPPKFARIKELLLMQQVIKEARNSFKDQAAEEEAEEAGPSGAAAEPP